MNELVLIFVCLLVSILLASIQLSEKASQYSMIRFINEKFDRFLNRLEVLAIDTKSPPGPVPTVLWNALKGFLCVGMIYLWNFEPLRQAIFLESRNAPLWLGWVLAVLAMKGHYVSPWKSNQNQSRSISVGFGAMILLAPIAALTGLFTYLLCLMGSRSQSMSELSALLLVGLSCLAFYPLQFESLIGVVGMWQVLIENEANLDQILEQS